MASLFKPDVPAAPAVTPAPPPPERSSAETSAAVSKQRATFFGPGSGATDTSLTGGTGAGATSKVAKFLGGVGG